MDPEVLKPFSSSASEEIERSGGEAHRASEAVLHNLEFFLRRLGTLSCCDFMEFPTGGFCLSTGSDSASENWVFFRDAVLDATWVRAAFHFFETRELPFIWPLLGKGGQILSCFGLREVGRLLAMSRSCAPLRDGITGNPRIALTPVPDDRGADRWAEAMWRGFGGESDVSEHLRSRVRTMRNDRSLRLVTAGIGNQDAGTFLTVSDASILGVYYFAVLPRYRRSGVATAMMAEILRLARSEKKSRVVLQATPSGVPFYRSLGFEPLGEIPLYSASDDVF